MKVVSLVPSLTELLIDLDVEVVGRTKFCIHPNEKIQALPKIGGTKTVDPRKVIALNPDLVIANKEENVAEQVKGLIEAGLPTYVSNITDFDSAIDCIKKIGEITQSAQAGITLSNEIKKAFATIPQADKKICYLIWRAPYMSVGGDTYINSILSKCGYENVFCEMSRYPIVTIEDIVAKAPDIVMLSSEPYPFKESHLQTFQKSMPNTKIKLVDGECFSWYGSRMLKAVPYLKNLIKSS